MDVETTYERRGLFIFIFSCFSLKQDIHWPWNRCLVYWLRITFLFVITLRSLISAVWVLLSLAIACHKVSAFAQECNSSHYAII